MNHSQVERTAWSNWREPPYLSHIISAKNKKINRIKNRRKKGNAGLEAEEGIWAGGSGGEYN